MRKHLSSLKLQKATILGFISGGIFLLSGLGKLPNILSFQHLIVLYGFSYWQFLAPFIVITEIAIGTALCLNIKQKQISLLAIGMVIAFTGIYSYGYFANDIIDCGCFGTLHIKTSPLIVYLRNFILISILFTLCGAQNKDQRVAHWKKVIGWTILLPSIFIAGMTSSISPQKKYLHPFMNMPVQGTPLSKFIPDSNPPKTLLSFMTSSCPHCINSIENFISYKQKGWVDTSICFILSNNDSQEIEPKRLWQDNFPEQTFITLHQDSIKFVDAFPMSFYVENDTIHQIIIGELPSPLLLLKH